MLKISLRGLRLIYQLRLSVLSIFSSTSSLTNRIHQLFSTPLQTLSLPLSLPKNHPLHQSPSQTQNTNPTYTAFEKFIHAFEACQHLVIARQRKETLWPLAEWREDKIVEHMEVVKGFLDPVVRGVLESNRRRKEEGVLGLKEDECSFLEFLAESTDG
jgi:hypothetical protein